MSYLDKKDFSGTRMDTVVFDVGNVLVDYNWSFCLDALGYRGRRKQELAEAVFLSEIWPEGDRGSITAQEWLQVFLARSPQYEKEIRHIFSHLELTIQNVPYAGKIVRKFRDAGFRIYYLSNYSRYLFEKTEEKLAFLESFDGGIFSFRENCIKPEEEIYNRLLKRYNIDSNAAWFFDDRQENVDAACAAGMRGIVFSGKTVQEILSGKYTGGENR